MEVFEVYFSFGLFIVFMLAASELVADGLCDEFEDIGHLSSSFQARAIS